MRHKTLGVAVMIGFALAVSQALAQRDNGAGTAGKLDVGAGAAAPASRPNENLPNPTNPNANDPNTKNPTATNPNVNDPNAIDPTAKITGRTDTSADVRTDQPGDRTINQGRRDERREAERDKATTARTDERGNRDDIQWRYKYYNGVWWYWLPENRWVYWSNNAWQEYNPATVQYQYEYDRFGRPLRYRSGYRGLTGQSDRTATENRTDIGGLDANRRNAENTRRDTDANRADKDANRTDRDNRAGNDPNRNDRDRETNKSGDARSEDNAKSNEKSAENKPGK